MSVEQVGRQSPDTMLFERASLSMPSLLVSTHAGRHRSSLLASTDDLPISLCLDVTVTAALKNDVIDRGAEEPGLAHSRKENQVGVGDAVHAAEMTFWPMAVENLGGWTELAIHEIKKLATKGMTTS